MPQQKFRCITSKNLTKTLLYGILQMSQRGNKKKEV